MSTEELTVTLFALTFTAIGAALGALVCALLALRRINRLKKDVSTAFNSLAQKQNSSRKELNELLTGNIGIIKKFQDFQESVERLSDKQADLELKEPEGRMYSRAKKMIQLGAGGAGVRDPASGGGAFVPGAGKISRGGRLGSFSFRGSEIPGGPQYGKRG